MDPLTAFLFRSFTESAAVPGPSGNRRDVLEPIRTQRACTFSAILRCFFLAGDSQYYSHEMGHMVMSCAAILNGWNTTCSTWESYSTFDAGKTPWASVLH